MTTTDVRAEGWRLPASGPEMSAAKPAQWRDQWQRMRHAHGRWLIASRVSIGLFVLLSSVLVYALSPLGPGTVPVGVAAATSALGLLALIVREEVWGRRQSLLTWSAVHDEHALQSDRYLLDLLAIECERGERFSSDLSLLMFRLRIDGDMASAVQKLGETDLRLAGVWFRRIVRQSDHVLVLSFGEVAVIAVGLGYANRMQVLERLRVALAANVTFVLGGEATVDVIDSAVTYGLDATSPEGLLEVARAAAARELARGSSSERKVA